MDNNKNTPMGEWIFDKKERETICSICESGMPEKTTTGDRIRSFEVKYCYHCGTRMSDKIKVVEER